MSLIDEALKRARMEAAQRVAEEEGLPYPTIPRHLGPRRRPLWTALAALGLAVVAGVVIGRWLAGGGDSTLAAAASRAPSPIAKAPPLAGPAGAVNPTSPPVERPPSPGAPAPPAAQAAPPAAAATPSPDRRPTAQAPPAAGAPAEPGADRAEPPVAHRGPRPAAGDPAPTPRAGPSAPSAAETAAPVSPAPEPGVGATAMTDPDSGVLLVLSEPAGGGGGEAAEETHVRLYPVPGGGTIELGGIAWSETGPFALINGRVVGPGSPVEGFTLERIAPGHVILTGEGRRVRIDLQ